jgi:hypothetical protein
MKQEPVVGEPYIYGAGKHSSWTVLSINHNLVTLRNHRNETITLKKVKHGEETHLQPLTDITEYPEGKKLPRTNPEDVAIRASHLLDRGASSYPLQEIRRESNGYWEG